MVARFQLACGYGELEVTVAAISNGFGKDAPCVTYFHCGHTKVAHASKYTSFSAHVQPEGHVEVDESVLALPYSARAGQKTEVHVTLRIRYRTCE